ncbi:MAG: methyltransferase domain-containing protein [Actinobacteria bacterium]|nr:methyltransferase domain-containing protein [Actinomycetota bacterium]
MTSADGADAVGWNGEAGLRWLRDIDRMERMLGAFTPYLLDAARIRPDDRVADIGCGGGETTRQAALLATRGQVLGVDVSEPLIERARERTGTRWHNVRFECADAQRHAFGDHSFDVVLSRFGVMFFDDLAAAFANFGRALAPGGRLAFTCWQDSSRDEYDTVIYGALAAHLSLPDGPGPAHSLADPGHARRLLTGAGFTDIAVEPLVIPMRAAGNADELGEAIRGVASVAAALKQADQQTTAAALDSLRAAVRPYTSEDGIWLHGAAWLVTAGKS